MKKSIEILEVISQRCQNHTTRFKYGKYLDESEKYKKGRVAASSWINELVFYFIQKEKRFLLEFREHLEEQRKMALNLKDGDYKSGLLDEISEIERYLKGERN